MNEIQKIFTNKIIVCCGSVCFSIYHFMWQYFTDLFVNYSFEYLIFSLLHSMMIGTLLSFGLFMIIKAKNKKEFRKRIILNILLILPLYFVTHGFKAGWSEIINYLEIILSVSIVSTIVSFRHLFSKKSEKSFFE